MLKDIFEKAMWLAAPGTNDEASPPFTSWLKTIQTALTVDSTLDNSPAIRMFA